MKTDTKRGLLAIGVPVLMLWIVLACFVGFLNATIMMIVCILLVAVLFAWIKFAVSCFEEE